MYRLTEERLKFLKELCEEYGPPGQEDRVLSRARRYGERFADECRLDKLGSLVLIKRGSASEPRVLIAAHADEVGFIINNITDEGFLTFAPVGGWFDQVLLAQRVVILTRKGPVVGVIASKPPHLLKPEERDKVIKIDQMYIDVGATSREEVEKELGVRVGDLAVPLSEFTPSGTGKTFFGKAFDDRLGVFAALEVLRYFGETGEEHPNTLCVAVTVQEEVGLRGAATVGWVAEPHVAIVAEVDLAGDVPGIKPREARAKLGKGPTIVTYDRTMIPNRKLLNFIVDVAEEEGIPYQLTVVSGGTDAGRLHLYKEGRPSIVVGVPTRHIHSHVSVFHRDDLENLVRLLIAVVRKLDKKAYEEIVGG